MVSNHQIPNNLVLPRAMACSAITMVKLLENRQMELKIRDVKNFAWCWPANTLAGVIQIRNHENTEDGRLGGNQKPHSDAPAQFVTRAAFRVVVTRWL